MTTDELFKAIAATAKPTRKGGRRLTLTFDVYPLNEPKPKVFVEGGVGKDRVRAALDDSGERGTAGGWAAQEIIRYVYEGMAAARSAQDE